MSPQAPTSETPVQYRYDVVLRDGSVVRLRALEHGDKMKFQHLTEDLLPDFAEPQFLETPRTSALKAGEGETPDPESAFVLVAELRGRIVAFGSYVRDANRPRVAEMAFAVDTALQGRGLGTALLDRLADVAREHGIEALEGEVVAANQRMLNMVAASGFEVMQRLAKGRARVRLALEPTEAYAHQLLRREAESAVASVRIFLEPRSVAIVGASRDRTKIGSVVLHNLLTLGYRGRVYPVNPQAEEIESIQAFASVRDVPEPVDLAVIAVPIGHVDAVVEDCIARGVRGILLLTAGYSETGAAGRDRERRLVARLREAGIRLIGPNCFGVINTDPMVRLNTSFSPTQPLEGSVGLLTQSGALGQAILDYARSLNLGLSQFVSIGNKADVSGNDLLRYWMQDERTSVILFYLESFGNPRKFSLIAREAARRKPIICVKAGRSKAGARAASSHTGSLAGSDRAAEALFRQCGVIRTNTLEELFDVARLLSHQPLPRGPRVAILTNAGGPAILTADACEAAGLELPTLNDRTLAALREFLPAAASVANPVDMIASADAEDYRRAMKALMEDPGVDALIVLFVPLHPGSPDRVARAIRDSIPPGCDKPVLTTFLSAQGMPPALEGIPSYRFPEGAVTALARALRYARWRSRPAGAVPRFEDMDEARARETVESVRRRGGGWMSAGEVEALLDAARIPAARARVAETLEQALEAADLIGYPVVLKALGPTILHKTEVKGVILNLGDAAAVKAAYEDLHGRLGDRMTGVLVQQTIPRGVEVLVGATLDATFGHIVAYGAGGTLAELIEDVALRLVPLTDRDADDLLAEARTTRLLRGWRGAPPADEDAVRDVLLRLSALLEVCPEIEEVDFNPTIVLERGARIVDARVRVGSSWRRSGRRPVF